jgi:hypothetical protein
MTTDTCDLCSTDDWPVGTILTGPAFEDHKRACQPCAEQAQRAGSIVLWDDPWSNPHHEVNQPFEAHR